MPEGPDMNSKFGTGSPIHDRVCSGLLDLFHRRIEHSRVALRFREWRYQRSIASPTLASDEDTFVRHTYAAILSRLLARSFLGVTYRIRRGQQLSQVLGGGFFQEQGIDNFAEDDYFAWPTAPHGDDEALEFLAPLVEAAGRRGVIDSGSGLLTGLYEGLGVPPTPTENPIRPTAPTPSQLLNPDSGGSRSVYHTGFGGGEALYWTVRGMAKGLLEQGMDEFDTLLVVLDRVAATDPDPLAVALGRANYLLALGSMVTGPHPPFFLPVYLSSAPVAGPPRPEKSRNARVFYVGESGMKFRLPGRVADDLQLLEWLAGRLPNYLDGAAMRSIAQGKEEATEAVIVAFHNYLLAPNPRTPIPEPLTPTEAEVMEETATFLIRLYLEERDLFRLFQFKNAVASSHLAKREFDRIVAG